MEIVKKPIPFLKINELHLRVLLAPGNWIFIVLIHRI